MRCLFVKYLHDVVTEQWIDAVLSQRLNKLLNHLCSNKLINISIFTI